MFYIAHFVLHLVLFFSNKLCKTQPTNFVLYSSWLSNRFWSSLCISICACIVVCLSLLFDHSIPTYHHFRFFCFKSWTEIEDRIKKQDRIRDSFQPKPVEQEYFFHCSFYQDDNTIIEVRWQHHHWGTMTTPSLR